MPRYSRFPLIADKAFCSVLYSDDDLKDLLLFQDSAVAVLQTGGGEVQGTVVFGLVVAKAHVPRIYHLEVLHIERSEKPRMSLL